MNDNYSYSHSETSGVAFDEGLRKFMLGVYNYMTLGIAVTVLISFAIMQSPTLLAFTYKANLFIFLGLLAYSFFMNKIIAKASLPIAHLGYWTYVVLWSLLIGPVVSMYFGAGMAETVMQAFLITTILFASLSIYGYTTKKDLSPWAKFLAMASFGLLALLLLNVFFFQGTIFSLLVSGAIIVLISGMTAYETQAIKNLYLVNNSSETNSRLSLIGAAQLYGSFIVLFMHILRIMGILRGE